jgi:hypothetical protein
MTKSKEKKLKGGYNFLYSQHTIRERKRRKKKKSQLVSNHAPLLYMRKGKGHWDASSDVVEA